MEERKRDYLRSLSVNTKQTIVFMVHPPHPHHRIAVTPTGKHVQIPDERITFDSQTDSQEDKQHLVGDDGRYNGRCESRCCWATCLAIRPG